MKTTGPGVLLLSALFLAGCQASQPSRPPSTRGEGTGAYEDPVVLLEDLNELLREADSPECIVKNPDLQTGYAERIPNEGAAVCEFDNGTPLYALIVQDGEATYERHFGRQFGPNHYLWGSTWVLITSNSAPSEALTEIRESLGASG